jgi:hypothetical protein
MTNSPPLGADKEALRHTLLLFDKSRGITCAKYVRGRISRKEADRQFEADIAKVLAAVEAYIASQLKRHGLEQYIRYLENYNSIAPAEVPARLADAKAALAALDQDKPQGGNTPLPKAGIDMPAYPWEHIQRHAVFSVPVVNLDADPTGNTIEYDDCYILPKKWVDKMAAQSQSGKDSHASPQQYSK